MLKIQKSCEDFCRTSANRNFYVVSSGKFHRECFAPRNWIIEGNTGAKPSNRNDLMSPTTISIPKKTKRGFQQGVRQKVSQAVSRQRFRQMVWRRCLEGGRRELRQKFRRGILREWRRQKMRRLHWQLMCRHKLLQKMIQSFIFEQTAITEHQLTHFNAGFQKYEGLTQFSSKVQSPPLKMRRKNQFLSVKLDSITDFKGFRGSVVCYYEDPYRLYCLMLRIKKCLNTFEEQELTEKSTQ